MVFRLYSDTFNGIRYYADLKFQFEKGSTVTAEQGLQTIAEVLIVPGEDPERLGPIAGIYQRAHSPNDRVYLGINGTLSLVQAGRYYQGTFRLVDNKVIMQIGKHTDIGLLQANMLIDQSDSKWVKRNATESPAPTQGETGTLSANPGPEPPPTPIAPPPPPPADPKTIELGQTLDQVLSSFGMPEKIIKLPTKQIYVYKDMRVTFVGGKVTDIQ